MSNRKELIEIVEHFYEKTKEGNIIDYKFPKLIYLTPKARWELDVYCRKNNKVWMNNPQEGRIDIYPKDKPE